jgi:hypothetical protein
MSEPGSSAAAMMPRRSPYFSSSAEAVFSPTPGRRGGRRGVAAHGGEVGVLAGEDGVLLDDDVVGDPLVVADAAGDVQDPDLALVVDELEQVAVAGDDVDGMSAWVAREPMTSSAS